jgi:farnesyl-diphosphate farnesyltransferase
VADTRTFARADRLQHLATLRHAYAGNPAAVDAVVRAAAPLATVSAERRLLEALPEAVRRLEGLPPADRSRVRAVLDTLTSGMVFDLTRFPGEDARRLGSLETLEELDHYIYLVAGCVGDFWTALHVAHRPRLQSFHPGDRATRFGKALQLTNVLRDVPRDLQNGRCYLPARELATLGLVPSDLLDPQRAGRARPLLDRLLGIALGHYDAAWAYTLAIPRREWRMRLACAWPLLIGLGTLEAVAAHPAPLTAPRSIKISRQAVRSILTRSAVSVWSNRALAADAARIRRRIPLA